MHALRLVWPREGGLVATRMHAAAVSHLCPGFRSAPARQLICTCRHRIKYYITRGLQLNVNYAHIQQARSPPDVPRILHLSQITDRYHVWQTPVN